jgi:nucleotide sugar dehydrogenase
VAARTVALQRERAGEATRTGWDAAVIGLGYVGLPLVREAAAAGMRVIGLDVDRRRVESLNSGRSHIGDLGDHELAGLLDGGFRATTDQAVLHDSATVVICVPTPLREDRTPDLSAVTAAVTAVAGQVRPGTLVVLESTTWPGTTEEVVRPLLERSGLVVGTDLHLAFSPERIDPGNPVYGVANTPKVVGGVTAECTRRAVAFYQRFVASVVPVRGTREAEMAKLLENTYRHVNIALVNEMAVFCDELGIDLWESIDAAATKPFGFQAFRPGPGVGGHCIPIDPNYLSYKVRELGYPFRFVELAQEVNDRMPAYVVSRVQRLLNRQRKAVNGSHVLLLGVTYKPDVADARETPAVPLVRRLRTLGAQVSYADPFLPAWRVDAEPVPSRQLDAVDAFADADICVLLQDHSAFDLARVRREARLVLDTRGVLPAADTVQRL